MDISKANSEAYAIYNRFHNSLNLSCKVAAAGLKTMNRLVDVENGNIIMGTLVDTVGMPWGRNKPFPNPTRIIDNVYQNLIDNTIIQAFSGFELYLSNLITDLAHFSEKGQKEIFVHAHTDSEYKPTKPPEYSRCCFSYAEQFAKNNVLAVRLNELTEKLNIQNETLSKLIPLFDYLRNLRNCISHLDGIANKDLIQSWENEDFQFSLDYWNKLNRAKAPPLPEPKRGKKVQTTITTSIMSSAVCFKIAQCFNESVPELLKIEGFVHMAAYHGLLIEFHDYRDERESKTAQGVISNYMTNRYFVKDVSIEKIINIVKKLDIWNNCQKRFEIIKRSHQTLK